LRAIGGRAARPALLGFSQGEIDDLVASWGDRTAPPFSGHLKLEIDHVSHVGYRPGSPTPLAANDPVPGCGCVTCATFAVGGSPSDAEIAEEIVKRLASCAPATRLAVAESELVVFRVFGCTLPPSGVLALLANRITDARRARVARKRAPLPFHVTRKGSILDVAARLGLDDPVRSGDELAFLCPLHDDNHPSLFLNEERGLWFCFACHEGGDSIRLVERVLGCSFTEAVQTLTNRGSRR
jgi:hypothetical protein